MRVDLERMNLLAFAFVLVGFSSAFEWKSPYFNANEENGIHKVKEEGSDIELTFEEETQVILLGNLTYKGELNEEAPSVGGTDESYVYIDNDNGTLALKLKKRVDYDDEKPVLKFRISKLDLVLEFVINLININDNPFEIQHKQPCTMDENQTVGFETDCEFLISDKDGLDSSLKFDFEKLGLEERFKFNQEPQDLTDQKEVKLKLISLRTENFDEGSVISNLLTVTDDGNPNDPNELHKREIVILINVNDLPNKAPEWTPPIGSITIKEEESDSKKINVRDGDHGLNWPVKCSLECTSNTEICPKIEVTPDCKLNIDAIILEKSNNNNVEFKITGTDYNPDNENDPNSNSSTQTVYLIIEDINNHAPIITISKNELLIDENSSDNLKVDISITDNDSNDFGKYTVSLESTLTHVDINDIMQVIPKSGYQTTPFSILIKNPKLLDYDDPDMPKTFDLIINSVDLDPVKPQKDSKPIKIILKDLNDEEPIWGEENGYTIKIKETFGRKEVDIKELPQPIRISPGEEPDEEVKFFATDQDKEPEFKNITYSIVGSSAQKLLKLKKTGGLATDENLVLVLQDTNLEQPFDFEREPVVTFTIQASDTKNVIPTQVSIILEDVNDEIPTIEAHPQELTIDELTDDEDAIKVTLKSADMDQKNELEYEIDSAESYVLKRGKRLSEWPECISVDGKTGILKLDPELAPEYEKYDTINLVVSVEDKLGEDPKIQKKTVTITITINNLPNLPLEFDQSSLKDMVVMEQESNGERIGTIKATDPDGDIKELPPMVYELLDTDDKEFVTIDPETGLLTVAKTINADPDKFELKLKVKACVGERCSKEEDFEVTIRDINNKFPKSEKESYEISIKERETHFEIHGGNFKFPADDEDRDLVNFDFVCESKLYSDIYKIDTLGGENNRKTGCSISVVDGAVIKREKDTAAHELDIILSNFKDNKQDIFTETKVTVNIIDINDEDPSVGTMDPITVDENWTSDLGTIYGHDEDFDTDNIYISYTLLDIKKDSSQAREDSNPPLTVSDFQVITDEDEVRNGKLKVLENLKGHYGSYKLTFKAENTQAEPKLNTSDNIVTLIVDKYCFKPVIFENVKNTYVLRSTQTLNARLWLAGDTEMDDFIASDQQGEKFDIKFKLAENEYFEMKDQGSRTTRLQMYQRPPDGVVDFELILSAEIKGDYCNFDPTEQTIKLRIRTDDSVPIFENPTAECKYEEEKTGDLDCKPPLNPAKDDVNEESTDIYYRIFDSQPVGAYKIPESKELKVTVLGIDLELCDDKECWFTVEASYQQNYRRRDESTKQNILFVKMDVKDTNNHDPCFNEEILVDTLLEGMSSGSKTNINLEADDPDNFPLEYKIDWGSYKSNGTGLPDSSVIPFKVLSRDKTAEIGLMFDVTSSMSGVIEFDVWVEDNVPPKDQPNPDKVHVQYNVIAQINLVRFVFRNDQDEINVRRGEIEEILSKLYVLTARVHLVSPDTSTDVNARITTSGTSVTAYFLDADNRGVNKETIENRLMDYDFEMQLLEALDERGLYLEKLVRTVERESLEETYEIALIAVCCASGVLIIGLIAFFTWKIRATNARLRKINQTEVRRPTMVANLPGANKRATQVVNPNINDQRPADADDDVASELSFSPRLSRRSIDDDDEDFVGVENNDIFKIAPK